MYLKVFPPLWLVTYILNNPVVANIVNDFPEYEWSSGSLIFNDIVLKNDINILDIDYIEDFFQIEKHNFKKKVESGLWYRYYNILCKEKGKFFLNIRSNDGQKKSF